MHDELGLGAVGQLMTLAPREVVMVLDVEHHIDAERPGNVLMNQCVIRRRISAHQLHCRPVLLTRLRRQIEPRQLRQFLWQLRVQLPRQPAVVRGDLCPGPSAAGVAQQRQIRTRRQTSGGVHHRERAELHEVIAAPARA